MTVWGTVTPDGHTFDLLPRIIIGCMIVDLLDYRPPKGKDPVLENPDRTRVVLTPSPETLWADLCLLNQRAGYTWTDKDALEVESRILVSLFRVVILWIELIVNVAGHRTTIMP